MHDGSYLSKSVLSELNFDGWYSDCDEYDNSSTKSHM